MTDISLTKQLIKEHISAKLETGFRSRKLVASQWPRHRAQQQVRVRAAVPSAVRVRALGSLTFFSP